MPSGVCTPCTGSWALGYRFHPRLPAGAGPTPRFGSYALPPRSLRLQRGGQDSQASSLCLPASSSGSASAGVAILQHSTSMPRRRWHALQVQAPSLIRVRAPFALALRLCARHVPVPLDLGVQVPSTLARRRRAYAIHRRLAVPQHSLKDAARRHERQA